MTGTGNHNSGHKSTVKDLADRDLSQMSPFHSNCPFGFTSCVWQQPHKNLIHQPVERSSSASLFIQESETFIQRSDQLTTNNRSLLCGSRCSGTLWLIHTKTTPCLEGLSEWLAPSMTCIRNTNCLNMVSILDRSGRLFLPGPQC